MHGTGRREGRRDGKSRLDCADVFLGAQPGGTKAAHQCFGAGTKQRAEFMLSLCFPTCERDYFGPIV